MDARIHYGNTMSRRQNRMIGLLLFCLVICPFYGHTQELAPREAHRAFFEQRALADATYEQKASWHSEEDELDYWKDQRNFERELKQKDFLGYQIYISNKREAYAAHQAVCGRQSQHGDYYLLQAAFYAQFASPAQAAGQFIATGASN